MFGSAYTDALKIKRHRTKNRHIYLAVLKYTSLSSRIRIFNLNLRYLFKANSGRNCIVNC